MEPINFTVSGILDAGNPFSAALLRGVEEGAFPARHLHGHVAPFPTGIEPEETALSARRELHRLQRELRFASTTRCPGCDDPSHLSLAGLLYEEVAAIEPGTYVGCVAHRSLTPVRDGIEICTCGCLIAHQGHMCRGRFGFVKPSLQEEPPTTGAPWPGLLSGDGQIQGEGILWCRIHRTYSIVGESGPDAGLDPGTCGCTLGGPGHTINWDRFFVEAYGSTWYWAGTSGQDQEAILRALAGQESRFLPPRSTLGFPDDIYIPGNLPPTSDTSDRGRILHLLALMGIFPTTEQQEAYGIEWVDVEVTGEVLMDLVIECTNAMYGDSPGSSQVSVLAPMFREIVPRLDTTWGRSTTRAHPVRMPGARTLAPGPEIDRAAVVDHGVVRCRRHGEIVTIEDCGPYGDTAGSCGCGLGTCMHVVGGCGEVVQWGRTWHRPHGRQSDDDLVQAFVAAGCNQVGTPWWDGLSVPPRSGRYVRYNIEWDVIVDGVISNTLGRTDVLIDAPFGSGPEMERYIHLGINQLCEAPPPRSGLRRSRGGVVTASIECQHP